MGKVRLLNRKRYSELIHGIYLSRLLGFGGCLIGAAICFFVSFMTLPFLAIKLVKLVIFPLCTMSHTSNSDLQNLPSHSGAQNSLLARRVRSLILESSQLGEHASYVWVRISPASLTPRSLIPCYF